MVSPPPCFTTTKLKATGYTIPGLAYGGEATFPEGDFYAADWDRGGFVLNAIWNFHSNGDFEEVGFSRGFHLEDINTFYVAYQRGGVYQDWRLNQLTSGTGVYHVFSIHAEDSRWVMAVDYPFDIMSIPRDSSTSQSSQIQVGAELTSFSSTMRPVESRSFVYYMTPGRGSPDSWHDNQTWCEVLAPNMHWAWVPFPTAGLASKR